MASLFTGQQVSTDSLNPDANMKQLNITYIVSTLGQTGPTRQLYNIIKYLNFARARVHLITLSPEPEKSLKTEFESMDIGVHTLGLGRVIAIFESRKALSRLLTFIKPDIIHSQGFRADRLISGFTGYPNRFSTQRNIPKHDYPLLYGYLAGNLLAILHRRTLKRIPNIVSCSDNIARNCENAGIRTVVIRNGVDLERYPRLPTQTEKVSVRSSLKLPLKGLALIFSGPLIRRKNPIFLIKAFLAMEQHPQKQLWVLGDGPLLEECRSLARDLTNVIVTGHVACVDEYLKAADVFVSPSLSEGFPNAVLEALAAGLPLVLSDIPSHRDIIAEDPRVGQLFPLDDPTTFINCLHQVNTDREILNAARHLATTTFSGQSMARAYQDLYESIHEKHLDTQCRMND